MPDLDTDSEHSRRSFVLDAFKDYYGENRVLNILTLRTEGSKSSVLTSCRGLGISLEEAQEMADMIPVVRGKAYTINECLYGDDEDKKPVKGFENLIKSYDNLLETVLKIEGLVCGISSHASGLYIFNDDYVHQNSLMRTPSGQRITCWTMGDSDKAGALKIDVLSIQNLDYIRTALNLLLEDGIIEWQGSLRATYKKYVHPDTLDYTTPEIWEMLGNGKASNIFQLSTDTGVQACKLIKPHSLKEMSLVNSLMRLSGDGVELPLEKYKKFRDNINLWYEEMKESKLNEKEINILEKYFLVNSGIACEQEDVMLLVQDSEISNFSILEANVLRKGISKKSKKIIENSKKMFFDKGRENGTREEFLNYVWNKQISLSLGYSFSRNHTCPYSGIGLQQLNLLYRYDQIYMQTAILSVNSSSEEGNEKDKIDYGVIAKAIGETKNQGVQVSLPEINTAKFGFSPQKEKNSIIFGLKGINSINNEVANLIIKYRPYSSFKQFVAKLCYKPISDELEKEYEKLYRDFCEENSNENDRENFRMELGLPIVEYAEDFKPLTKLQIINLIKAGCFDEIESISRKELMRNYLRTIIVEDKGYKEKLTQSNLQNVADLDMLDEEEKIHIRYYNFNKYILNKEFYVEKIKNKQWILAKDIAFTFFEQHYINELKEDIDYRYTKDGIVFCKSSYDKIFKARMNKLIEKVNDEGFLKKYNEKIYEKNIQEIWDKYCEGSQSDWEMDSLSFYHGDHALAHINTSKYNISNFKDLSEDPITEEEYQYKGKTWQKYQIVRIAGTILDNDRNKHTITLLTHDSQVVSIKFYSGAFIHYNKVIAEMNEEGKKVTKEKSWLARGNKVMLVGYRRGEQFVLKTYNNSIYRHTVSLIESIDNDGNVLLKDLRYGQTENNWGR